MRFREFFIFNKAACQNPLVKYGYKARTSPAGFSLVEILISLAICVLLLMIVFFVYDRTMFSYRCSEWKQEKVLQAELFWNELRKCLEQATDVLQKRGHPPDFRFDVIPRPFKFKSAVDSNGTVFSWNVDHVDENGDLAYRMEYRIIFADRKLQIESSHVGGPGSPSPEITFDVGKTLVTDVESINVGATNVKESQNPANLNEQYLETTPTADAPVGSVVEISLLLTPPAGLRIGEVKVAQNNKFKLNVAAVETALP
ncbi:MAG: prepilin-type N-terminal cleavage/methylation domain-containing protein [Candidatus Riflebacteria bacterium]|nr:prepilin-type N-terminal cleavage/methylation domain-containing protein [Candidatus Riflebacteria bacterium]